MEKLKVKYKSKFPKLGKMQFGIKSTALIATVSAIGGSFIPGIFNNDLEESSPLEQTLIKEVKAEPVNEPLYGTVIGEQVIPQANTISYVLELEINGETCIAEIYKSGGNKTLSGLAHKIKEGTILEFDHPCTETNLNNNCPCSWNGYNYFDSDNIGRLSTSDFNVMSSKELTEEITEIPPYGVR